MELKCVAVGDGTVGKTSLIKRFCKDSFDNSYVPTTIDNAFLQTTLNGKQYGILFIDTAGQEDYDRLRALFYDKVDVFLVCFSVIDYDSFENVTQKWFPELAASSSPNAQKILVGTKCDLRDDPKTLDELNTKGKICVKKEAAEKFAREFNMKYVECSALTKVNIDLLLKTIAEVVTQKPVNKKSRCCVNAITRFFRRICCKSSYYD